MLAISGFLHYDEFSKVICYDSKFHDTHKAFFVEKSKTDVYRDGVQIFIAKMDTICCPVTLLSRHVESVKFALKSQEILIRGLRYHSKIEDIEKCNKIRYLLKEFDYWNLSDILKFENSY